MLTRVWRTRFRQDRLDELTRFANEVSIPVLSARPGYLGFELLSSGGDWLTITYWEDQRSIDATESSPEYHTIVEKIQAQGFLIGSPETIVYESRGGAR